MLIKYCILVLTLLILINLSSSSSLRSKKTSAHFQMTCSRIRLTEGSTLSAVCRRRDQTPNTSRLDLNRCVTNENGRLINRIEGMFSSTCQKCVLIRTTILSCQCRRRDSIFVPTSIDLSLIVDNTDGNLVC